MVTSGRKSSLPALTGLRFFAAFSVVVYHFARPAVETWPGPLVNLAGTGFVAVSLFFLLSGFVLAYSYLDLSGRMRGSARSFWVSRLARIYPAYLLAFLLAAPTNIIWSLQVNSLIKALAKLAFGAFCVLTLQQAWTPFTAWYWNFPAWSVSVEAFFYLSFPVAAICLARLRQRYWFPAICALWVFGLSAPTALYLVRGVTAPPGPGDHLQMAVEFTPLLRLPEFLIGILLGRYFNSGFRFRPSVASVLSWISGLAAIGSLAFFPRIPHPLLANGLLVPLFAVLIYSLAQDRGSLVRFLSLPALVLLGEASYGIYILQIPVAYVLRLPPPHNSLAVFGLYSAVLIAASILSWRYVESPLRGRIRGWLDGKTAPVTHNAQPAYETPAPDPKPRPHLSEARRQ